MLITCHLDGFYFPLYFYHIKMGTKNVLEVIFILVFLLGSFLFDTKQ